MLPAMRPSEKKDPKSMDLRRKESSEREVVFIIMTIQVVWQKPGQRCKRLSLQLKNK